MDSVRQKVFFELMDDQSVTCGLTVGFKQAIRDVARGLSDPSSGSAERL
jgi:hypothetical protein